MADGLGPVAVVLVPVARPTVEDRDAVGLLVLEARPEHVGEELVIAIPLAAVVERDQEQVCAIERLKHRLAARLTGHGIAQRACQPVQDRRVQQEAPDLLGLTVQDLLDEIVDDVAVVPGESRDEAGDVVSALDRERRQLERRDPAFRAPLERGDIPRSQVQTHHLVEVGECLGGREPEIGRPDLGQFAPCAQAGQRQGWIGAGGDHHVYLRG